MAYTEATVTSVAEIPDRVYAFASSIGWSVDTEGMTRPGGGEKIALTTEIFQSNNHDNNMHIIYATAVGNPAYRAITCMPRLNGSDGNPDVQLPTRVHLFGHGESGVGQDIEPFIAVVIECGFNLYRHLYIGNLVKFGTFDGGEVVAANYFYQGGDLYDVAYHNPINDQSTSSKFLFSARGKGKAYYSATPDGDNAAGFAKIEHPDNINDWRVFYMYDGNSVHQRLEGTEIFGGANDGINDGFLYRGLSDYAGANILTPFNLYCSNGNDGSNYRIRPVGFPSGVRMVNMEGIEPGAVVDIGQRRWHVFPEFSKQSFSGVYANQEGGYWEQESSYLQGLAYLEGVV